MPKGSPEVSAKVALDTAVAALHAVSNLTAVLAEIATSMGAPSELIRAALSELDAAHQAVIQQQESKELLSQSLASIQQRIANTD
jgi:predicted  nucleic acid-binding Zn-ribbon protein